MPDSLKSIHLFLLVVGVSAVGYYVHGRWLKSEAASRFRATWSSQGKDLLLVYSNSPHWKEYVEDRWLPKWKDRAVVMNLSERQDWKRSDASEAELFRAYAGIREYNPLGIVVSAHDVRVVRFWLAFRDYKHGKGQLLRLAEVELEVALELALGDE